MKSFSCLVAISVMLISEAQATIRFVSSAQTAQYMTVTAAYVASVAGDTIMIGPGTFSETTISANRRLHWMGAGFDLTTISPASGQALNLGAGTGGSIVEGLRLTSGSGALVVGSGTADSITVRRCLLRTTTGECVTLTNGGRVYFQDCVFMLAPASQLDVNILSVPTGANRGVVFRECVFTHLNPGSSSYAIYGNNGGAIEIYNSVFLNFSRLFNLTGSQPLLAINNIACDWTLLGSASWGTFLAGSAVDYFASDLPAPPFPASFTNTISLVFNNPFVNYVPATNYVIGTTDLHLTGAGGVLLTDTGHPAIFDLDSTQSDLGIYGGPLPFVDNGAPWYPFTTSLTIPSVIGIGDSVNTSSSGRIGPRY